MITIEKVGDAIRFTFVGNDHYLNEGTIEVPINSLSLVTDDSGMATFKKSASNDVFISATYQELGMTKAELEEFYKENMVGKVGSEITPEEVEEMIDEAVSDKQDQLTAGFLINIDDFNDEISVDMPTLQANVDNWINDAVAGKADATAVTAINNSLNELDVEATEETKTPVLEMTDFNDMTTYTCMSNLGGDNFIMILEKNEFFMRPWGELYLNFRGMNMHWEGTMMFMLNGNNLDISAQNVTIDGEQYNYSTTIPFEDKMVLDLRSVFPTIMAEISFNIQNQDMDSMFSKISFYNDAVVSTFTDWKTNVNNTIDAIDGKEQALAEALYDLKDEKQDQLIAGSGIQLSGNNISAVYNAVTVMHEEYEMYNRMEPFYVKKADDCGHQTTGDFRVMVNGNSFMFTFDYANGNYFGQDIGWEEYLTIEWNSEYQMFLVTPLQTLESAGDSGCVRVVEPYDILVESETTNASIKQLKSGMSERITYTDANNIFLTQNAAEITYLKKEDALVDTVDYTLQDFYNNSYCGFEGKVVKIQDGYNKFAIRTAGTYNWSPYYIINVGKGLLKESFTIALSQIIEYAVKNGASRFWDDLTTEEFLDDGLVGRYLFYIEAPINEAFVYFKIENYTINRTNSGATFEFAGKMYHDTEFTMPYRNEFSCDWYLQGSYVIDGTEVIIQSSTFNAAQLEGDGFFGSDINNGAASIYDSNGIMHKVSSTSIRAHAPSGYFTYFLYALINDFNSVKGDSFAYLPTEDCITYDYIQEGVLVNNYKLGAPIKMIDYSKLKPFNFKYNIDTSSTDSHGVVGYEYSFGNIPSTYSTDIDLYFVCNLNGNNTNYTLGHYNATTKEITYYDEGVEGIYTIEVLNNGHRIVKLEDAAIAKHFTITNFIGNAAIYNTYYVHYQPYSFVDKVNDLKDEKADTSAVTEEISAAVSGKVDTSAITSSVTSASTDSEVPTAKAVFDAIPTGSSITIDSAITSGSTNAVEGGAIYDAVNAPEYPIEGVLSAKHFWDDENMGAYTEIGSLNNIKVPNSSLLSNPYISYVFAENEEFMGDTCALVATVTSGSIASVELLNGSSVSSVTATYDNDYMYFTTSASSFSADGLNIVAVMGNDFKPSNVMELRMHITESAVDCGVISVVGNIPSEPTKDSIKRIYDALSKLDDVNPIADTITLDNGNNNAGRDNTLIGYGVLNYNTYNPITNTITSGNTADVFKYNVIDFKGDNNVLRFNKTIIDKSTYSSTTPHFAISSFTDSDTSTYNYQIFTNITCMIVETNPNASGGGGMGDEISISISGPNNIEGEISFQLQNSTLEVNVTYSNKTVNKVLYPFAYGESFLIDLREYWDDTYGTHTFTVDNWRGSDMLTSIGFYNVADRNQLHLEDAVEMLMDKETITLDELDDKLIDYASIESVNIYEYGNPSAVTVSTSSLNGTFYGFSVSGIPSGSSVEWYISDGQVSRFYSMRNGVIDNNNDSTFDHCFNKELTNYENGVVNVFLNTSDAYISRIYMSSQSYQGTVYQSITVTPIKDALSGKVETSAITSSVTSASTDAQVPSAKAVYDQLGGMKIVKLTQAQYDALSPNYDNNTLYVIKD